MVNAKYNVMINLVLEKVRLSEMKPIIYVLTPYFNVLEEKEKDIEDSRRFVVDEQIQSFKSKLLFIYRD